jgi:glycine dehydrogenase subunit 2
MAEPTIYEISSPGRTGIRFPEIDVPTQEFPDEFKREDLPLPELSELDVVRHFTRLSRLNYSVDNGFYPLGSCTMKYNPRINEVTSRLDGFSFSHPMQPIETVQGNLAIMYLLQEWLGEITGLAGVSLQPAAGAHGELVGGLIIRAYHEARNDKKRKFILVPDSAHGTNPATSSMTGFTPISIPTDGQGNIDLTILKEKCNEEIAGLMLTNPNTLGLFEQQVVEVINEVHACGGLVYGDGANLNALLGIVKPGDLGFDIMHLNLHKTFSTPHGGGGPGSGPVAVTENLKAFLPAPIVGIIEEGSTDQAPLYGFITPESSIGRVKSFYGHFAVIIRAFTYILMNGGEGLRKIAEYAVLNANYLMENLKNSYELPYDRTCMHEFVLEGVWPDVPGIHALDISKRLMDYGFHPPTNYFPLIVKEALMIEPTETESKQTLDEFIETMKKIAQEAKDNPDLLHEAPHNSPVGRLDEVKAARDLVLCCWVPDY